MGKQHKCKALKRRGKKYPNLFTRRWEGAGRKTRDTRKRTEPLEEESKGARGLAKKKKEHLFLLHWKKNRLNAVQISGGKKEEK